MNDKEIYKILEKAFVTTFLDELLPGIFHNFANPLNGIMGRSKLLQRRLVEFVKKVEIIYPSIEQEMGQDYKKLLSDVNAINNETDRFFDMFQVSTAKFYAIGTHAAEKIDLSNVIEREIGFADFYLDFKHNINKEIHLDKDMPYISGIASFYSMAFWMLMRCVMIYIRIGNNKEFFIKTDHDDHFVIVSITTPIDSNLFMTWQEISSYEYKNLDSISEYTDEQKNLFYALFLLQQGSEGVQISLDGNAEMLTIKIPYNYNKRKA